MLLRFLCALSLSIWVGGFTFYSAVVIPLLHYALGTLDTGFITQRVTHTLNGAWGAHTGALVACGLGRALGRAVTGMAMARRAAECDHVDPGRVDPAAPRDGRPDRVGFILGFYLLHRACLIASTVQWFVNLGLMALLPSPGKDRDATD